MTQKPSFEYFEHTADIGLRGYGASFPEALEYTAKGMIRQLIDIVRMEIREEQTISIQGGTREDVVIKFLNRLIFLFETGKFVPLEYHIELIGEKELKAVLKGDIWNSDRDEMNKEVKAATYHQLQVEHTDQWVIQVILDI